MTKPPEPKPHARQHLPRPELQSLVALARTTFDGATEAERADRFGNVWRFAIDLSQGSPDLAITRTAPPVGEAAPVVTTARISGQTLGAVESVDATLHDHIAALDDAE